MGDGLLDEETLDAEIPVVQRAFQVGDSVVVKPGVQDPDGDGEIGGWHARVTGYANEDLDENEDPPLVEMDWDSISLRRMTRDQLMEYHVEGLQWWTMQLYETDLEHATPRDTEEDVARVKAEMDAWIATEEEAAGILYALTEHGPKVLALAKAMPAFDQRAVRDAWHSYLRDALRLPFIAELYADTHRPLRKGDRVTVRAITRLDPEAGTMVRVEHKRAGTHELPLTDLDIPTPTAANFTLLEEYVDWRDERPITDRPHYRGLRLPSRLLGLD